MSATSMLDLSLECAEASFQQQGATHCVVIPMGSRVNSLDVMDFVANNERRATVSYTIDGHVDGDRFVIRIGQSSPAAVSRNYLKKLLEQNRHMRQPSFCPA